jgi:CRP/FNR family transcriptional regulator, cyclic AMP receptor protein
MQMTALDALGFFAASLVLATFCARTMVTLRVLAMGSNVAFIAYATAAGLWPILLLHLFMLPLNAHRLYGALVTSAV